MPDDGSDGQGKRTAPLIILKEHSTIDVGPVGSAGASGANTHALRKAPRRVLWCARSSFGGGDGEKAWQPMLTQEMAKHMAAHGGLGLAVPVFNQMLRMQEMAGSKQ